MHVGLATIFQNPHFQRSDHEVYRNELRLTELAEPLGFESVWGVEHHFTDYTMCPDVLQFLTYMAGRTTRVKLGSMVVVLPWHDPVRVAEQVAMLDNISDGRMIFGMGRGLGRVEFDGFRIPMAESRERFVESAEMILDGLERGYVEYDGKFFQQPKRELHPAPFQTFRGRTCAAAVSPESARIMAKLGVAILIIPQKPWESVAEELAMYRGIYREVNHVEAPPPLTACWVYCDKDASRARDMAYRYIGGYYETVIRHYEFGSSHFASTRGYEYYGNVSTMIDTHGAAAGTEFFTNLQVWGTPDECYEKILDIRAKVGCETVIGVFSYAGMEYADAERNLRLFASEVKPRLQALGAPARVAATA
jgi:alkanesulfonate monooxygenase SsuD/methylene tetrahydromethanopterin reductase-like flavin-dependent oxidoreductase (luciferase family)